MTKRHTDQEWQMLIEQSESSSLSKLAFCKLNGLILYDYMAKYMKELAKADPNIDALLPWNFKH
ncbi:transposase domain-containing protein [Vibrio sp.]|uniref:transposase domain-containing protein n=1 Tax=Vibrio sp. TaxID=678 RepID=UPI003AA94B74